MGFLRFDKTCPECDTDNCCHYLKEDDWLPVKNDDLWYFPDPIREFGLYEGEWSLCQNGEVAVPGAGSFAEVLQSSFSFSLSNIDSDAVFGMQMMCNGVCTNIITSVFRSNYGTDQEFLEAILLSLFIYGFNGGNTKIEGNQITVAWIYNDVYGGDSDVPSVCLCGSTLVANNNYTLAEMQDSGCKIPSVLMQSGDICNEGDTYVNILQLQGYGLCITVDQPIMCMEARNVIKFKFPGNMKLGDCYRICFTNFEGNIELCSQPLVVTNGCDSMEIRYRNANEQWTVWRVNAQLRSPTFKTDQTISRTSRGKIRKLYATVEKSWLMETDYYAEDVHTELANAIQKDYFYFYRDYPERYKGYQRYTCDDTYKIDWDADNPQRMTAKGSVNLLETNFNYANEFCTGSPDRPIDTPVFIA